MSQENVKTVLDATAAFNRGDLDTWSQYWTDDIDHRAVEGALDDRGPIHGKDALRAYVQDWLDTFDDFRFEPVEFIDAGKDKVVAVLRVSGRAKLSGVGTDLTYAVVYTIRDGKIARGREYWTRDEALEAAGCGSSQNHRFGREAALCVESGYCAECVGAMVAAGNPASAASWFRSR